MKKYPSKEKAMQILKEAEKCNPGAWVRHSRVTAHCAQKIAEACDGLDPDKAYVLGLLHDIGRKFGFRQLGHISDGYTYMMSLGYTDVAKVCLTHSFHNKSLDDYVGKFDTSDEELNLIKTNLQKAVFDDYDRLIQLCDSLAGTEDVMHIEDRMNDIKMRYGNYPQEKWDANIRLKTYFEEKAGRNIYNIVGAMVWND
ncbi:MAG: HDOD domain-containing protein [Christensenellaceae bacterium]|nr:HDOD domain-containing protein [Christensenellaceae bacterium]